MKHFLYNLFFLIWASGQTSFTLATDFGDPYFMWEGSYARSADLDTDTGGYRISTYVPPTTLVFLSKYRDNEQKLDGFTPVITQHGQRLLVVSSSISSRPYKTVYGDLNFIFHEDSFMCPEDNKSCTEATGIDLRRGDVLMGEQEGSDFIKLQRDERIGDQVISRVGYIDTDVFERHKATGIVTDAGQRYPRILHADTKAIKSLATDCGQTKKSIDVRKLAAEITTSVEPTGIAAWLKDVFSIKVEAGIITETNDVIEASYGGDDIATGYLEITLREPGQAGDFERDSERVFYAATELMCVSIGSEKQPIFVRNVVVKEGSILKWWREFKDFYDVSSAELDVITSNSPQFDVFRNNGNRPFLTSINTRKDYANALKIWAEQVEDISIATILLELFNATCPNEKVAGRVARESCHEVLAIRQ